MWPYLVEIEHPAVARHLLASARPGWIELQLCEIAVHPLVAAIVLRAPDT
jgi:hypothetical protein